ncbi:hypothetical protein TQ29_14415 [Actibacterium sp. EMB200-NS6]|nr:hypothetical protein TQ29_14415 [Actibacterium sp. EMB200-NS6]
MPLDGRRVYVFLLFTLYQSSGLRFFPTIKLCSKFSTGLLDRMHAKAKFDEGGYDRPESPNNFSLLSLGQRRIVEICLIMLQVDFKVSKGLAMDCFVHCGGQIRNGCVFTIFHD